jgi:uncharacterized protein
MTLQLKFKGEIRDPIHGLIPVTSTEFELINTPVFQRLRRIRQLAMSELGFHGAAHNRFGHSIGVMHVVWRLAEHLENSGSALFKSNTDLENLRIAALLHDLGHGPFSHVSEYLLQERLKGSKSKSKTEEIHESITQSIIRLDKDVTKILGKERSSQIADMLANDGIQQDFRHDLVSGPLDGDKMDYLIRDSYYAGVQYGHFDLERLINVITLVDENKRKRLAIKMEGIQTAEQYVLAKYFIASQVYQHKSRHVTDRMIIEGIRRSIIEGNKELESLYSYSDSLKYLENYVLWYDQRVFESVLRVGSKKSLGKRYFEMLHNRVLPKEIICCKFKELTQGSTNEAADLLKKVREGDCDSLRRHISVACKLESEFTHVMAYSLKTPLVQRSFGVVDEEQIRVKFGERSTSVLDHESQLYKGIVETAGDFYVQVFGMPKNALSLSDKKGNEKKARKILRQYFEGRL